MSALGLITEPFLTSRLADFLSWRETLEGQVDNVRSMLERHESLDDETRKQLDELSRRIRKDKLTIAFVSEAERGKSELINALFFSERRRRLLASGPGRVTLCVTELRYDRDQPTCLKLLPVETRESSSSFNELLADESLWRVVPFNYEDFDSIQRALGSLSETKRVTRGEALAWGMHRDGASKPAGGNTSSLVDVPRWRHAIVNMPHPVLLAGLVVIDTPGLSTLAAEPELSRKRIPECDCVVFVLDAKLGVTKQDLMIWRDYLGGKPVTSTFGRVPDPTPISRLVVLNKIDQLHEDGPPEAEVLRDIDKLVKEAADLLRVEPIKVIPLSARLGFIGKTAGDRDKLVKSRLYQIERGITRELGNARQVSLSNEVKTALGDLIAQTRARLDEARYEALERLRELGDLRERNQKLIGSLVDQASTHFDRYEAAIKELRALRSRHALLNEELSVIVNRDRAKEHAKETMNALSAAVLPGAVQDLIDGYLAKSREHVVAAEAKIDEIKRVYTEARRKLIKEFAVSSDEILPFSTQRFLAEMQKADVQAEEEFKRSGTLLLKRGSALGEHFMETLGSRMIYLFEIAARESHLWMRGLIGSMEKAFDRLKEVALQRAQGTEKLKMADIDLAEKISELQAELDIIRSRHAAMADCASSLDRHFGETRQEVDMA
jgi:hypothetical protein